MRGVPKLCEDCQLECNSGGPDEADPHETSGSRDSGPRALCTRVEWVEEPPETQEISIDQVRTLVLSKVQNFALRTKGRARVFYDLRRGRAE